MSALQCNILYGNSYKKYNQIHWTHEYKLVISENKYTGSNAAAEKCAGCWNECQTG